MFLIAALVVWIQPAATQTAHEARNEQKAKVEETIRNLEERRFQAMIATDTAALNKILSEDLVYTHATGQADTKKQFLDSVASGRLKYESIQVNEATVRVYGTAAVVTGRATMKVSSGRQGMSFQIRFTDVYANRDGHWQMVAWQSTRLPEEKKE
jgi:uncharacterized protein (TIGR02246 family)